MPESTIGRVVILRNQDGADFPAIITAVIDDLAVHVQQFVPPGVAPMVVNYEWGVEYSAAPRPGTWRWPERT
jgi:hypothetical protein